MASEGFLKEKCGPRAKKFEYHGAKGLDILPQTMQP